MRFRSGRIASQFIVILSLVLSQLGSPLLAQNFRGGISGSVTDPTGAVVPGALVTAVATSTNTTYKTITSSAGEFVFSDLPLGNYTVSVSALGFAAENIKNVSVSAGVMYALPVKVSVKSTAQTIEVQADALTLNTTSDTETTVIPEQVVQDLPNNGRDFTQMISQTNGFGGYSINGGAGYASVNGTRTNSVNWQIEGTDNNDLWWNIPAVNQGGVSGIAGVILPVDAIENFSFLTTAGPETGRNAGGTANLVIKSGTNQFHGTAYYFNRNEFFAAKTPFANGAPKNKVRNQHYGFSVGGPILQDRTFFFLAGEHQGFVIGNQTRSTEPSAAYQALAMQDLAFYGVPLNSVSQNLLTGLWPQSALTGAAVSNNYFNPGTENGHSFNGIIKLDENLTDKDRISAKWFIGQGNQIAPTSSYLSPYYEEAPIHVQNYSLVYNRVLSPSISNQLSAGVSYYNQVFLDADNSFDPVALGLNTGVTSKSLAGAPHIVIGAPSAGSGLTGSGTGFDAIGVTTESGRNDITGQLNEDLAWILGAHQFRFGGEFRQAQVDDFYQSGQRSTFNFNGSQGPWYPGNTAAKSACVARLATKNVGATAPVTDANVLGLADFLAGCINTATIVEGDPKRQVFQNTFTLNASDSWQASRSLSLNYGVRYDYPGVLHSANHDLTSFDPTVSTGIAVIGVDRPSLYDKYWKALSPRLGFAWQPFGNGKTVVRGGYGLYYDAIYIVPFLNLRGTVNNGPFGVQDNPAGTNPVVAANASILIIPDGGSSGNPTGTAIFPSLSSALAGTGTINLFAVDRKFRPSTTQSFNLNLQHSLTSSMVAQLGYVGTVAQHLTGVFDINQAAQGSGGDITTRPYYKANTPFQNYAVVNEVRSNLNSNYNSLQTSLRIQNWRGLTSQVAYTWSHALDYETGFIPYLPQNSFDPRGEYGNSDFDTRNTFTGYASYTLPGRESRLKSLTSGWEFNSAFSFHGGQPYTVVASSNTSGNGENADRANLVGNPYAGVSHKIVGGAVTWFSPTAFADPAAGQYGTTRRGQFYNPGYSDVDFSVFKSTPITERVKSQFRVEIFNLFNRTNYAPVGAPQAGETAVIGSTIGAFDGAPGIGPGEPYNMQFALKITF
jgi:hypothetical protein